MDPLTVTVATVAVTLVGFGSAAWQLGRRIRRVEAQAAQLRQQLRAEYHAANHDPLTGLPNRRGLFRLGERLLAEARGRSLVAVVVDLDDFKQANDRYGHAVGDQVLVTIANRFAGWAGPARSPGRSGRTEHHMVVARLGGDEFAGLLVVPGADTGWLRRAAARLTEVLSAPVPLAGERSLTVTASVGFTVVPAGMSLTEALHRADAAMYRAKTGDFSATDAGRSAPEYRPHHASAA